MRFAQKLAANRFVLTGEVAPPKGAGIDKTLARARNMATHTDAINVTDNQRAVMRMSSLATAGRLAADGLEPILQMTCRDRNRLGLQSDLLGAHALGIHNILALTGDPVTAGTQPDSKAVFDLSSAKLIEAATELAHGRDLAGNTIAPAPDLFLGAAVNPNAKRLTGQLKWLERKLAAGAAFIQTQAIYDHAALQRLNEALGTRPVPILAGVLLLRNARMARFLRDEVPGVEVPEALIARLEATQHPRQTGIDIAIELFEQLAPLADGVHLMSVGQERSLAEVAAELRRRVDRDFTTSTRTAR